jgi:hypothetical protein
VALPRCTKQKRAFGADASVTRADVTCYSGDKERTTWQCGVDWDLRRDTIEVSKTSYTKQGSATDQQSPIRETKPAPAELTSSKADPARADEALSALAHAWISQSCPEAAR